MPKNEVQYRAKFEKSMFEQQNGRSRQILFSTEDPDDAKMKELARSNVSGYLSVYDLEGKKVRARTVAASEAVNVMKACLAGRYNPIPKIKSKKQEVLAPVAVKGE